MTPLHYQDFTIKARTKAFDRAKELLILLGADFLGEDEQVDTYFKTEKGKLKLRVGKIENLITHYERISENGIERTVVYRYDLNPSPQEVDDLLNASEQIGEVKKLRAIYLLGIHKIHLDKVENGQYIEIESIDREGVFTKSELKDRCWKLKEQLEIANEDLVPTGYFTAYG